MWQKINIFVRANTILSAFLITVLFLLLTMAAGLPIILRGIVEETIGLPIFIAYQLILSVIGIFLMKKLQVLDEGDFKFKNICKGFLLGWVVLLLAALMLVLNLTSPPEDGFHTPDPLYLLIAILYPFIVAGLFEEVVFRGILLKILLKKMGSTKKGITNAILISAAIFAAAHAIHLIWQPPLTVLSDLIFPTAGGIFLGVIYLRTKTLIVPILLHGLLNLTTTIFWAITSYGPASVTETTLEGIVMIVLIAALPLIITAFVLLRKVKPEDIAVESNIAK